MTAVLVAGALVLAVFGADDIDDLANQAGVDVVDLQGAVYSTGLGPREYLVAVGQLPPPLSSSEIPPAVLARVACIEAKESGGANVWNRHGSGAGGVMQYIESTFRRGAAEMGHPEWSRWEPWQARLVAAHDLMHGRRAQWTVGGC